MCRAVRCRTCQNLTWAGCGAHVDEVMASVAPDERCPGHPEDRSGSSWLQKVFGTRGAGS